MNKMKFGTKIKICKILGTGYPIDKKIEDSNDFLIEIFNVPPMLPIFFTSIPFLLIQPSLQKKKKKKSKTALIWFQNG